MAYARRKENMFEKAVEKMAKFFGSPVVKWVGVVLAFFGMGVLSSFTTKVNIQDQFTQFTSEQYEKSIQAVVDKSVTPQLKEQSQILSRLETKITFLSEQTEGTIIRQIERDYEQYQKGNYNNISETNLKYEAENWVNISDDRKNAILEREYTVLMDYYARIKK
jgi:hypothetical protein